MIAFRPLVETRLGFKILSIIVRQFLINPRNYIRV